MQKRVPGSRFVHPHSIPQTPSEDLNKGANRGISPSLEITSRDGIVHGQLDHLTKQPAKTPRSLLKKIAIWRQSVDESIFHQGAMPDERLLVSLIEDIEAFLSNLADRDDPS